MQRLVGRLQQQGQLEQRLVQKSIGLKLSHPSAFEFEPAGVQLGAPPLEPLLEAARTGHVEALEQSSPVQRQSLLWVLALALELEKVALERSSERHRLGGQLEQCRERAGLELVQFLPQIAPRRLGVSIDPQQLGQGGALDATDPTPKRQICHQRQAFGRQVETREFTSRRVSNLSSG